MEIALVLAVFALHAGWPIPDVNESHYLVKARHFWNPEWIAGDFFLEPAADASRLAEGHLLFYVLTGWLTRLLPLYWYGVVGRVVTWWLLAWGWQRLSTSLLPIRWIAPLSAALFVAFNGQFQMAGEWVVGGFEAKGLAYAMVFFALAAAMRAQWMLACVFAGAATSMHALVGGWTALLLLIIWWTDPEQRPTLRHLMLGAAIIGLLAMPGVLPALALDRGVSAEVLTQSRMIYVFERLPHHLVPTRFRLDGVNRFLLLFVTWVVAVRSASETAPQRRLRKFVLLAVSIAAAGVLVSWTVSGSPQWQARLMRYYWFRTADFALPLGAAFALLAVVLDGRKALDSMPRRAGLAALIVVAAAYLGQQGYTVLTADRARADAENKILDLAAWREATDWARKHTPHDARFITPRTAQTFKWYAERSEVATWKDLPQDAPGIVEWWHRMVDIYDRDPVLGGWKYKTLAEVPVERLAEVGRRYDAQYVLAEADPPLALPRLFGNSTYTIYRLEDTEFDP